MFKIIFGLIFVVGVRGDVMNIDVIIDKLISILTSQPNEKLTHMNESLNNITHLVTDKETEMKKLIREVDNNELNNTNFYEALNDNNKFDLLYYNVTVSLYDKLKSRMNRNDVLELMRSNGRRTLNENEEELLEDVVDRFLAKVPHDTHRFNRTEDGQWDPEPALEEIKEYHSQKTRRIYKGERTNVRFYPFMVSLHLLGRFWCGGAIFWADLIITSASCLQLLHNNRFFRENPNVLKIRIGSNHSRHGGEMIDALEVYFHPSYNPRTLAHNLAMIRLRRALYFRRNKHVPKWIPIADFQYPPAPTTTVLILGWGVRKTSQTIPYSPVFLQSKVLPIYPNTFCREVYGDKFVTRTQFCAGTMTTGEGACNHDAGGPAIVGGRLVGIISYGPAVCGYPNTPTVFTLLGPYLDWIESINTTMRDYYRGYVRTTTTRRPFITQTRPTLCVPGDNRPCLPPIGTTTTATRTPGFIVVDDYERDYLSPIV